MTPIEVNVLGANITANVTCGEFPVVGDPRIITTGGHLDVNFTWTQTGLFWTVLPANAVWEIEAVFEQIGGGEEFANPKVVVPHVLLTPHVFSQTINVTVGNGPFQINPGRIYQVYAKITLKVNNVIIACGFGECNSIHVME
jgi:hypothetical protein